MIILGISAFYHDSAASLLKDGKILSAVQEERFTRKKHDPSFPTNAVKYCLESEGLTIDDLDFVVFYDKPLLKFERLLETYYANAPKGLRSFIASIPVWLREKLFLKRIILKELQKISNYEKKINLLFPEHHLSHAASAFYPSTFEEAAILTIDGVGEWATCSIFHGKGSAIKVLKELRFPHSLGLLYSAITYFLGFKVNSGEYKLMGLAPYGNIRSDNFKKFKDTIEKELIEIKEDGSIVLNQRYFSYATGLRMVYDTKWEKLFGFPKREPEAKIEQIHCDFALAIQKITERIVFKMAKEAKRLTGSKNLCLAGGVALNCVSNGRLINSRLFEKVFIQPASGDAGGSLGAALAVQYIYLGNERKASNRDTMQGAYLGPYYTNKEIELVAKKYKAKYTKTDDLETLCATTADLIARGSVVGWMQGRMEFGPRALGNRSILGDPRNSEMQKKINLKIKYRESFRPFAPSVLEEDAHLFFQINETSPYMLVTQEVNDHIKNELPENYHTFGIKEKLYFDRSKLPAITHVDFSARIQTVNKEVNPVYWKLLHAFKKQTGYGMLVNTSFNVRGEPIVCTPEDAYRCFMRTDMDILVIDKYLFKKSEQQAWKETKEWKEEFVLD